jgi:triosephosphate isomerase (TIM)
MRIPLIAGNWKMNTSVEEAISLVNEMLPGLKFIDSVERVVCPPFISLYALHTVIKDTGVYLGAQNMYFKEKGAYTGEISPLMLNRICKYVVLGHSERRQIFAETNLVINQKVKSAFEHGLIPILCVGETLEENESGNTNSILENQLRTGLKEIPASKDIVIAYEPIWAIGTGKAASGEQAETTIHFIRNTVAHLWGKDISDSIRILYGGSVTGTNISEFIKEPNIDGALVGGASLKAAEFVEIVRQSVNITKR